MAWLVAWAQSFAGGRDPGLPPLVSWLVELWSVVLVLFLRDSSSFWTPPDFWDAEDVALEMAGAPNIWTDGSREDYPVGGFEVAVAGVYLPAPELAMDGAVCGVAEEYGDARLERCRAVVPVPGPPQTVQRAEFWGVIVSLQAYWPCH